MMRAVVFTLCVLLLTGGEAAAQEKGTALLERAGMSRAKGPKSARVVVMEISDFQCPYCGRFAREIYPLIDSAYVKTGKVQWVFVNLPLPSHEHAWAAAEAALCAGWGGADFWVMHDRLFQHQVEWSALTDPAATAAQFRRYAQQAGASPASYDACVAGDRIASLVLRDVLYAASAQISGTPAFIINNDQPMVGVKSFEEWKRLLDAALAK